MTDEVSVVVRADIDRCAGHGRCNAISERLFPQDDDGRVAVAVQEVHGTDVDAATDAAAACPERAISLDSR